MGWGNNFRGAADARHEAAQLRVRLAALNAAMSETRRTGNLSRLHCWALDERGNVCANDAVKVCQMRGFAVCAVHQAEPGPNVGNNPCRVCGELSDRCHCHMAGHA